MASRSSARTCRAATSASAAVRTRSRYAARDGWRSSIERRGSPVASRSARVRGSGSVEPIMLMRSPGAPWVGWRGFQPVKVASGASSSTGRTPAISLPSASTADTKVTNGAPTFGGSSVTMPRASSGPKSRRTGRSMRSGKLTPGIFVNTPAVTSASTAVPSARRGTLLAGGSTPSVTHRSRLTSAARRSGAYAGQRVGLVGVGEREQAADGVRRVQRGLTDRVVELAAPRSRDVRDHGVEDAASRLVLVQAEVEEVAEKASALRDAEGVRAVEGLRAGIPVGGGGAPEPRGGVAHREEAQAHERRVRRAVHQLRGLPRLEAGLHPEAGSVRGSPRAALPPHR